MGAPPELPKRNQERGLIRPSMRPMCHPPSHANFGEPMMAVGEEIGVSMFTQFSILEIKGASDVRHWVMRKRIARI